MIGKQIRLGRISDRSTGNFVIVPMDHGTTGGPSEGLFDVRSTVGKIAAGGATAVLMHKGLVRFGLPAADRDIGLVMHLSASTDIGTTEDDKVLVSTVVEAIKSGADAVSIHINVGADTEPKMLKTLGDVAGECAEWGVPLMAMAYPRGPKVKDPCEPSLVAHAARLVSELGADIVKCNYTGDIDSFREVVKGAMAPVVIAGGTKTSSEEELLQMVYDSIQAGGRGVSIGRNIFQYRDVEAMTRAVSDIVIRGYTPEEAMKGLGIRR